MTPLDEARAALEAAGDMSAQEQARRLYYSRLALAELYVPLTGEDPPRAAEIAHDGTAYALAFDSEERLAALYPDGAARAVLSGRALIAALEGRAGLGVNLGDEATAMLLPPEVLEWIAAQEAPANAEERSGVQLTRPHLDAEAVARLDPALAMLRGHARAATLVGSGEGHLLLLEGVAEAARAGVARDLAASLRRLGLDEDLSFAFDDGTLAERAAQLGLRIDVPALPAPRPPDPKAPPKLPRSTRKQF